ncbi:MAG: hypothetical protein P8X50_02395 [Maritimibacter sp.]
MGAEAGDCQWQVVAQVVEVRLPGQNWCEIRASLCSWFGRGKRRAKWAFRKTFQKGLTKCFQKTLGCVVQMKNHHSEGGYTGQGRRAK